MSKPMNVLLIGQGGREHAIAWKIAKSPLLNKLYITIGNAGTSDLGENAELDINNFVEIKDFVLQKQVSMVIVGPEEPLVKGIHDFFLSDPMIKDIPVIGPVAQAAQLEGSKDFAKGFMERFNIPTARYKTFTIETLKGAPQFLKTLKPPYVLKADGLAAGKGVLICQSFDEAIAELEEMIEKAKFGNASRKVVIEEFLDGIECSVFILTDGNSYKILPEAKDYKRIGEGDTGPNTGGMGSVSPVPFADKIFMKKVEDRIIIPTMLGLKSENLNYKGFIFFGLMKVGDDPFVIEYNVRMGDPEAESVIPRIKSDLMELFTGVAEGNLHEKKLELDERFCVSIFLVSEGYPGNYKKGMEISGFQNLVDGMAFHAGTKKDIKSDKIISNGGRVVTATSLGETMEDALAKAYNNASRIQFEGKFYRKDIGLDLRKL
jgi:phosphoribosylamine---glycine ligase